MKKFFCLLTTFIIALLGLCACAPVGPYEKEGVTVTLLNGKHYHVNGENKVDAPDGKAVFKVTIDDGYSVSGTMGDKCEFTVISPSECEVRFNGSHYSCVAQLETQKIYTTVYSIYYFLGSGDPIFQDCTELAAHHYMANTFTEHDLRERGVISDGGGRALVGWQTEDGDFLGLGNRSEVSADGAVYLNAVWKDYNKPEDFTVENGKITAYSGSGEEVVIPRTIGGEEITTIGANAFENCSAKSFYVPSTVTSVEQDAFRNCTSMTDFYMSDNLTEISDLSFRECKNLNTVHINAFFTPLYVAYNDGKKSDVMNGLSICKGKKLVIMGGSSVMYGYSGGLMEEILGDYSVFDLGLMGRISQTIWLDLIEDYLGKGDIYLHAPELNGGAVSAFFNDSCLTNTSVTKFDSQMLYVLESDWGLAQNLKINNYSGFFDVFGEFGRGKAQAIASGQSAKYTDYNTYLDDYGSVQSENDDCNLKDYVFGLNGPFRFDEVTDEFLQNAVRLLYEPLAEKEVKIFFTFSPLNLRNLFELYTDENGAYAAADDYTRRVRSILDERLVTILLTQGDSIYDSEYFCDTDYHLGHTKRIEHTREVAEALKAQLS